MSLRVDWTHLLGNFMTINLVDRSLYLILVVFFKRKAYRNDYKKYIKDKYFVL